MGWVRRFGAVAVGSVLVGWVEGGGVDGPGAFADGEEVGAGGAGGEEVMIWIGTADRDGEPDLKFNFPNNWGM